FDGLSTKGLLLLRAWRHRSLSLRAQRSNLVTLAEPARSRAAALFWPTASWRDCFVALRAPRNDRLRAGRIVPVLGPTHESCGPAALAFGATCGRWGSRRATVLVRSRCPASTAVLRASTAGQLAPTGVQAHRGRRGSLYQRSIPRHWPCGSLHYRSGSSCGPSGPLRRRVGPSGCAPADAAPPAAGEAGRSAGACAEPEAGARAEPAAVCVRPAAGGCVDPPAGDPAGRARRTRRCRPVRTSTASASAAGMVNSVIKVENARPQP